MCPKDKTVRCFYAVNNLLSTFLAYLLLSALLYVERERSPSRSLISSGFQLRRSKRLRAPTIWDPHIRLVHKYKPSNDGYSYAVPIGVEIEPTAAEVRKYRRMKQREKLFMQAQNNPGLKKELKKQRTQKLRILARRYHQSPASELYFCEIEHYVTSWFLLFYLTCLFCLQPNISAPSTYP